MTRIRTRTTFSYRAPSRGTATLLRDHAGVPAGTVVKLHSQSTSGAWAVEAIDGVRFQNPGASAPCIRSLVPADVLKVEA